MAKAARLLVLGLAAGGCVEGLDLPAPPNVAPTERSYETPTAELSQGAAEAAIETFLERRERLRDLDDLRALTSAVVRFEREVTVSEEDGAVSIGELVVTTDAIVELSGDCPGFEEGEPARDAYSFVAVIRQSELIPTVWGTVEDCRFASEREIGPARVLLSGEIVAYLPNLLTTEPAPRIIFVSYELSELEFDDRRGMLPPGHFRLVDDQLELLVSIADLGTVVVSLSGNASVTVRAANGAWTCYYEERRCEGLELSSDGFSY